MRWCPRHSSWIVVACLLLVSLWEVLAINARRAFPAFTVTAADFAGFPVAMPGWTVERLPIGSDPLQPNILVIRALHEDFPSGAIVQCRLVHGYNLRDCMRLKGYTVTLLDDTRKAAREGPAGGDPPVQTWLLESATGDRSVWLTTLLRAEGLEATDRDVRSVPFPRITVPMDPGWAPAGLRLSSLRHPLRNFRLYLRSRWNNARCDPLVFIGLKRPPWADPATCTYLTLSPILPAEPGHHAAQARAGMLHRAVLSRLRQWHMANRKADNGQ